MPEFLCAVSPLLPSSPAVPACRHQLGLQFHAQQHHAWSNSGQSQILLTGQSSLMAVGTSDVVASQVGVSSNVNDNTPDTFSHAAYTLTMKLTDLASGTFTNLAFNGYFTGTVSAHSANIQNFFTGLTSQTAMLGGNTYTVTMTTFTPPGPGGDGGLQGAIGAHALVTVQAGGGPHNTPEPSSLILAGLGLCGLGLLRKRRRNVV